MEENNQEKHVVNNFEAGANCHGVRVCHARVDGDPAAGFGRLNGHGL